MMQEERRIGIEIIKADEEEESQIEGKMNKADEEEGEKDGERERRKGEGR
jgi:hypothetical protein